MKIPTGLLPQLIPQDRDILRRSAAGETRLSGIADVHCLQHMTRLGLFTSTGSGWEITDLGLAVAGRLP